MKLSSRSISSWKAWLAAVTLVGFNFLFFVPDYLLRAPHQPWQWQHFAYDFGLVVTLVVVAAPTRVSALVRRLAVAVCVLVLLVNTYHCALRNSFGREPALWDDWRLALNLWHFMTDANPLRWASYGAVLLVALSVLTLTLNASLRTLQQRVGSTLPRAWRLALAGSAFIVTTQALSRHGLRHEKLVFQLGSRPTVVNVQSSISRSRQAAALMSRPVDRRYDKLMQVRLGAKPNVYLLMIEAYGEVLATWDMRAPFEGLLRRMETRLGQNGYHFRTAYSRSPVHSGTSWLAIATVQTGLEIDSVFAHTLLEPVGATLPSWTTFFKAQGYQTLALMPGNRARPGLRRFDLYQRDVLLEDPDLDYRGPIMDFGHIPDQFSLEIFRRNHLPRAKAPHFSFFMSVSTHYAWRRVPKYARVWDPDKEELPPNPPPDPSWEPLYGEDQIGSVMRANYFSSVVYDWRVVADFIERVDDPDAIFVIVGDHQPFLEATPPRKTFHTPVHVVSKNAALVERFEGFGLEPGLFVEPRAQAVLTHAGLFSLVVAALANDDTLYTPQGLGLEGIHR